MTYVDPWDRVPPRRESWYRDRFAELVGGKVECTLRFGRADVITDTHVFEVKRASQFTTAVVQALGYAAQCGLKPGVALYGDASPRAAIWQIQMRCRENFLALWVHDDESGWRELV